MKTIYMLAALVLLIGCSSSSSPKSISKAEAAEKAWAAMETAPSHSEDISRLIETGKIEVAKFESDGRVVWRVCRTDEAPIGVLVPAPKPNKNTAIASAPDTHWVVGVDITTGEVVWKYRPTTR